MGREGGGGEERRDDGRAERELQRGTAEHGSTAAATPKTTVTANCARSMRSCDSARARGWSLPSMVEVPISADCHPAAQRRVKAATGGVKEPARPARASARARGSGSRRP